MSEDQTPENRRVHTVDEKNAFKKTADERHAARSGKDFLRVLTKNDQYIANLIEALEEIQEKAKSKLHDQEATLGIHTYPAQEKQDYLKTNARAVGERFMDREFLTAIIANSPGDISDLRSLRGTIGKLQQDESIRVKNIDAIASQFQSYSKSVHSAKEILEDVVTRGTDHQSFSGDTLVRAQGLLDVFDNHLGKIFSSTSRIDVPDAMREHYQQRIKRLAEADRDVKGGRQEGYKAELEKERVSWIDRSQKAEERRTGKGAAVE